MKRLSRGLGETLGTAVSRGLAATLKAAGWLIIAIVALLAVQWPLRAGLNAYSRGANDAGQCLFAIYIAVSVTAATRRGTHLAVAKSGSGGSRRMARLVIVLGLMPWAGHILAFGTDPAWRSLLAFEHFPDTLNPGYFLIRGAVVLLALSVLAQAVLDFRRGQPFPAAERT